MKTDQAILKPFQGLVTRMFSTYTLWRKFHKSRKKADRLRKKLVAEKAYCFVDRNLKKKIKTYCKQTFGSRAYWHWIALYAEIKDEFKEGWIPNDFFVNKMIPKLNPPDVNGISDRKTMDYRLFSDMSLKSLLIIVDQLIFDGSYNRIGKEEAYKILTDHNAEVVIKIDGGSSGNNLIFIQSANVILEDYLGKGQYIIQPVVRQHMDLNVIYPHSVNTLRVLTFLDSGAKVNILALMLKLGTNGKRVDNVAKGGRYIYLNTDGHAISDGYKTNTFLNTEKKHPDTGYEYKKIKVPGMQKIIDMCVNAHYQFPYTKFVGWDVFVDENGKPGFVEWNANLPLFWYHEVNCGPMFDGDELKKIISG